MKKVEKIRKAFETLGLAEGASEPKIIKAYRKLSLKWHPDRFGKQGHLAKTKEEAEETFKKVSQAKMILLGEEEVYDDEDGNENSDYREWLRKLVNNHLKRLLEIYEISRLEYQKIIREEIAKKGDLDFNKYCEKFIDFENQLKNYFSSEEIKNYQDHCVGMIECVYSIKRKNKQEETAETLKNLKSEKEKQDKWRSDYFSNDKDEWWEQEQERTKKFGEQVKEEQNESYDTWKAKFNERSKQSYIEDLKSELLFKKISDEKLNEKLGVSDWKAEIEKCPDSWTASDKKWNLHKLIREISREFICEKCGKMSTDAPWTSMYDDKQEKSKYCSSDCVYQWEKDNKLRVSNWEKLTYPQKLGVLTFAAAIFIGLIVYIVYRNSKDRKAREWY